MLEVERWSALRFVVPMLASKRWEAFREPTPSPAVLILAVGRARDRLKPGLRTGLDAIFGVWSPAFSRIYAMKKVHRPHPSPLPQEREPLFPALGKVTNR